MSYTLHNFATGGTVKASDFNEMDAQIAANEAAAQKQWTKSVVAITEEQRQITLSATGNITDFYAKVTVPANSGYSNMNVYAAFTNSTGSNVNAWIGESLMSTTSKAYFMFSGKIMSNIGVIDWVKSGDAATSARYHSSYTHDSVFEIDASNVKGAAVSCSSASKFPVGTVVTFYYR